MKGRRRSIKRSLEIWQQNIISKTHPFFAAPLWLADDLPQSWWYIEEDGQWNWKTQSSCFAYHTQYIQNLNRTIYLAVSQNRIQIGLYKLLLTREWMDNILTQQRGKVLNEYLLDMFFSFQSPLSTAHYILALWRNILLISAWQTSLCHWLIQYSGHCGYLKLKGSRPFWQL